VAVILTELNNHIERLINGVNGKYGLNFRHSLINHFLYVDVFLSDSSYPYGKDWMPQMSFTVYLSDSKVILKALRLPKSLQNKGIGTYCFNWLVELCKACGIERIEGEATVKSKKFWEKKGCTHTPQRTVYYVKKEYK